MVCGERGLLLLGLLWKLRGRPEGSDGVAARNEPAGSPYTLRRVVRPRWMKITGHPDLSGFNKHGMIVVHTTVSCCRGKWKWGCDFVEVLKSCRVFD